MVRIGVCAVAKKPICIICGYERERFPFDIQHRKIIRYKKASPSDFTALRTGIVERLRSILEIDATIETIVENSVIKDEINGVGLKVDDLTDMEFSALCVVYEDQDASISAWSVNNAMERAGYTKIAARISLRKLEIRGFVESTTIHDQDGQPYLVYAMSGTGEDYIMQNTDKIKLKRPGKMVALALAKMSGVDDYPF